MEGICMEGIIENLYVNKELYSSLLLPVCNKYKLTMAEMLVLLFLSKNAGSDTASDIVNKLKITKSHVSASVRDLEERGYLQGSYEGRNHRTIHLQLCDTASEIIREGKKVQEKFLSVISRGFTREEIDTIAGYIQRMNDNANDYMRESFQSKRGES